MSDIAPIAKEAETGDTVLEPSSPRVISGWTRWAIPCLFALCFAVVVVDHVESLRRVRFAEYLAQLIREHPPADVAALHALLGDHVVRTGRGAGNAANGEPEWVWFKLKPALWLSLNADVLPPDDRIGAVRIVALGSTDLPLDDPASGMPLPDPQFFLFCALITLTGAALGYWRFSVAKTRVTDSIVLVVIALLLALMMGIAMICWMRVTF